MNPCYEIFEINGYFKIEKFQIFSNFYKKINFNNFSISLNSNKLIIFFYLFKYNIKYFYIIYNY